MRIRGAAKIIRGRNDYYDITGDVIIIAWHTHPDLIVAKRFILAIVSEVKSPLCHAAIVARENNIPLIMGATDATALFKDGDIVTVDTERGTVCLDC